MLERALAMPVSEYLAAKPWQPPGIESKALWALDRAGGNEETRCCISARARDFARFGRLMRDGGRCNGRLLVPVAWSERTVLPGIDARYGHVHRHLGGNPHGGRGDFLADGHNGQYCISTWPRGS